MKYTGAEHGSDICYTGIPDAGLILAPSGSAPNPEYGETGKCTKGRVSEGVKEGWRTEELHSKHTHTQQPSVNSYHMTQAFALHSARAALTAGIHAGHTHTYTFSHEQKQTLRKKEDIMAHFQKVVKQRSGRKQFRFK